MVFRIELKGRTGCIVLPEWTPASEILRDCPIVFDSLRKAVACAHERVSPKCDYAIRVIDDGGSAVFVREEQASPSPAVTVRSA
ncbi:MAG TPA: hypothetical protein VGY54_18475 [Polyangiaceae bacterium]|jgi:hypothetical protein|nr:hypothetical protein [Polyangiaceae bacterium]